MLQKLSELNPSGSLLRSTPAVGFNLILGILEGQSLSGVLSGTQKPPSYELPVPLQRLPLGELKANLYDYEGILLPQKG